MKIWTEFSLGKKSGSTSTDSISQKNYFKAIDLLEQRFGRKENLINTHMIQLLQIPPLKCSCDVKSFRQLFDKIQINLRSLESLGIASETFSSLLCPVILKSLTDDLVFEFFKKDIQKPEDNLMILVHWLLLKNGFQILELGCEVTI